MKLRELMPDLDGYTELINGQYIDKNNLIDGNATLIHFWSISCNDCKKRFPYLTVLRDEKKVNLNVIAIHMPRFKKDMDTAAIKNVISEYNLTEPILIDNNYTLTDRFKTRYVPAYYLFDKTGKLRHYQSSGSIRMLQKRIERVIEGK